MTLTPSGRPLRADAERNRVRVLDAAADAFSEHGLEASVDDIARRAGVGTGTVYRRFPTKDALINELIGHLMIQLADLARSHIDTPDGTGLELFLDEAAALLALRHGFLSRMWDRERVASTAERTEYRVAVAALVDRARAAGRVSPQVEASDVTLALWSVQGVITQSLTDAEGHARKRLVQILLAGLRAGPPPVAEPPLTTAQIDELVVSP